MPCMAIKSIDSNFDYLTVKKTGSTSIYLKRKEIESVWVYI